MLFRYFLWLFAVALSLTPDLALGEMFNALVEMKRVVDTQSQVANSLMTYVEKEEARLTHIKRVAIRLSQQKNIAEEKSEQYLEHPIHAFLLIKGLTIDWKNVKKYIKKMTSTDFISKLQNQNIFPDEEDLKGATEALSRLQQTYNIKTSDISNGKLAANLSSPKLTASDCMEIGRTLVKARCTKDAISWLKEAHLMWKKEDQKSLTKLEIVENLAITYNSTGNIDSAMKFTKEWLHQEKANQKAKELKKYLQKKQNNAKVVNNSDPDQREDDDQLAYRELCRQNTYSIKDLRLRCITKHEHPLFKLSPLKEEILNIEPYVSVFHHVISDAEINHILKVGTPQLERSQIQAPDEGSQVHTVSYRTSKSAFLNEDSDALLQSISKRVSAMTGLSTTSSEELQVLNYGIGGHYNPHFDFVQTDEKKEPKKKTAQEEKTAKLLKQLQEQIDAVTKEQAAAGKPTFNLKVMPQEDRDPVAEVFGDGVGNRIATVLFYLTNVEAGGATVFPRLGIKMAPTKGSCLFWYNLKRNGQGDKRTKHAACPVLVGTKWVCNKWLHESGQEFRRPCGLRPEE